MPLPIIAVVAARLGIKLATYMVGKHLKKGAAKKLRKAITQKRAEIAKKKETSEKGYRGQGSKRQEEKRPIPPYFNLGCVPYKRSIM